MLFFAQNAVFGSSDPRLGIFFWEEARFGLHTVRARQCQRDQDFEDFPKFSLSFLCSAISWKFEQFDVPVCLGIQ